jgi:AraC-like DNA-binding protein
VADPVDAKLIAPLIVDEILLRLLRTDAAATLRASVGSPADAQRVLQVMQFIRENYADKLRVEELARRVAMSPSHFAHRFQAVARISPMRYLRQVRLEMARERLLRGARVSEAAVEVGFESPAHFTREFKRRFGVRPSTVSVRV